MLLIVTPFKLDAVKAVADHYGLECVTVGKIVEGSRYRVFMNDAPIADLPVGILGDAPLIEWPASEPRGLNERRSLPDTLKSADPARDLIKLIGSIHGRERSEIWEQYDCQVQLRTTEEPGCPASAIKLPDSDSLVVFSMEGEPWKCRADPYAGAAETMAQSIRVLTLAGANVLGMTNCLNFPSPENPENFYELSECVSALAAVCRDLDCPVVSGNVSLYNETTRGGIYPTPLVVTAGLIPHWAYYVPCGAAMEGDAVYLVGPKFGVLGASRWQVLNDESMTPRGTTYKYDPQMETSFAARARMTSHRAGIESARVIAGGGLAAALAKEAVASNVGMDVDLGDLNEFETVRMLFGEGGPRAVYMVHEENEDKFLSIWEGYPTIRLGRVGGDSLSIRDILNLPLDDLKAAYYGGDKLLG
jgi:phosphoribosylformylglycinamidine synthase